MKKEIPIFWGCLFTHNYPFLMRSIKTVLGYLNIEPVEIEDVGCCPYPQLEVYDKNVQLALSARNLILAERKGNELIVPCNGCFNTLNGAHRDLKDHKLREEINSLLPRGMRYDGKLDIMHLLDILNSKLLVIETLIKRPLEGLKVAVHYGCHILRPPAVSTDNPENPISLDQIVEAAGAESIDYEGKIDCCGFPATLFNKEEATQTLRNKLRNIKGKADCIVVTCPACFPMFDNPPPELKELGVPVIHVSELLCLAFGVSPGELFFEEHTIKVDPVLEKLKLEKPSERELVEKYCNIAELESHCEACRKECTATVITRDTENPFDPLDTVDKLLEGKFYEVIRGKEIWRCLQCGKCEERCPNNIGLKSTFSKLRELAIHHGEHPKMIEGMIKNIKDTGYSLPKNLEVRKKMGIEPAPEVGIKEIKQILEKIKREKK